MASLLTRGGAGAFVIHQLKQSQAVRRIAACLTAVRVRTVGGAFAHWCSQVRSLWRRMCVCAAPA